MDLAKEESVGAFNVDGEDLAAFFFVFTIKDINDWMISFGCFCHHFQPASAVVDATDAM